MNEDSFYVIGKFFTDWIVGLSKKDKKRLIEIWKGGKSGMEALVLLEKEKKTNGGAKV